MIILGLVLTVGGFFVFSIGAKQYNFEAEDNPDASHINGFKTVGFFSTISGIVILIAAFID